MDLKGLEIDEKGLKIVFWDEMWIQVLMHPHSAHPNVLSLRIYLNIRIQYAVLQCGRKANLSVKRDIFGKKTKNEICCTHLF